MPPKFAKTKKTKFGRPVAQETGLDASTEEAENKIRFGISAKTVNKSQTKEKRLVDSCTRRYSEREKAAIEEGLKKYSEEIGMVLHLYS